MFSVLALTSYNTSFIVNNCEIGLKINLISNTSYCKHINGNAIVEAILYQLFIGIYNCVCLIEGSIPLGSIVSL